MSEQETTVVRGQVEGLGQTQEAALAALQTGSTFRQAAEVAGVARPTIYRWMQNDPHFRAAYNAWKLEQGESARGRLVKLADQAVDVIQASLSLNDRKAAVPQRHQCRRSRQRARAEGRSINPPEISVPPLQSEF